MTTTEVSETQPFHLADKIEIPASELSLFLARHGVGKSAVLINLALDQLLAGNPVLHFTTGMSSEKTHQYYQELYRDYTRHYPANAVRSWDEINANFMVVSYLEAKNLIDDLESELHTITDQAKVNPTLVLIDGLESNEQTADELGRIHSVARSSKARFVAAMTIHRYNDGAIDLDGPMDLAKTHAARIYWLEHSPNNDRIQIKQLEDASQGKVLSLYFCPHDFIFKAD